MSSTQKLSNACVDENVIARWFAIICKWHSLKDKSSKPNFRRWIPVVNYLTNFLPLILPGLTVEQIDEIIVWIIHRPYTFECNNHTVCSICRSHMNDIRRLLRLSGYINLNEFNAISDVKRIPDDQINLIADRMEKMYKSNGSVKTSTGSKYNRRYNKNTPKEKDIKHIPKFEPSVIEGLNHYIFTNGNVTKLDNYGTTKNDRYEINNTENAAERLRKYKPDRYGFIRDRTLASIMSFVNTNSYYVRRTVDSQDYSNAAKFLATHRVHFAVVRNNRIEYLIEIDNKSCPTDTEVELPEWYVNALNRDEYTLVDSNWNLYDYSDGLIAAINIFVNTGRQSPNQYCYRMDNHHFDMKKEKSRINRCLKNGQLPQLLLPRYYSSGCRFCYDSYNLQKCSYCMCCIISTGLISCRYTSYSDRIYGGYMVNNCKDCKLVYYLANSSCCFNCAYSYRLVQCMCCIDCIGLVKAGQFNKPGYMVNDIITEFQLRGYMMKEVINNHTYSFPVFDFIDFSKNKRYTYTYNTNGIYVDNKTKEMINYISYDVFDTFGIIQSIGNNVMSEIKKYNCGRVLGSVVHDEITRLKINVDGEHIEEDGFGVVETGLKYPDIPYYLIHLEALRGYDDDWDILDEESEESEENIVDDY